MQKSCKVVGRFSRGKMELAGAPRYSGPQSLVGRRLVRTCVSVRYRATTNDFSAPRPFSDRLFRRWKAATTVSLSHGASIFPTASNRYLSHEHICVCNFKPSIILLLVNDSRMTYYLYFYRFGILNLNCHLFIHNSLKSVYCIVVNIRHQNSIVSCTEHINSVKTPHSKLSRTVGFNK